MRKLALAIMLFAMGATAALAADFNGKWTAEVHTPRGTQNVTFNLHVNGSALTGTITTPRGDVDITDGKVDGETITFSQVMGGKGGKFTYTGKADGDSIQFSRQRGERPAVEFTAHRAAAGAASPAQ